MRALLFTLMLAASAGVSAAVVYKWVDANGVTHYSDTPVPGAVPTEIGTIQTFKATPVPSSSANAPEPAAAAGPPVCLIDSPTDDQVFVAPDSVQGHVSVSQPLQPDQRIVLTVDGASHPEAVSGGGGFVLTSMDRGAHTLSAEVQDADGKVLCTTPPVTINVRQPSVYSPLNPPGAPRPH